MMKFIQKSKESFEEQTIGNINKLIKISEKLLIKWGIDIPKRIEFYDSIDLFIKRILPQVIKYGLTKKQAIEFIKASLNSGSYGTFSIKDNTIIEMNFNPNFKKFYPSIHFLNLLIHESLHLFLYLKIGNIYPRKFKFEGTKYIGEELVLQLDEGFAKLLTNVIMTEFNTNLIKDLPIWSELNEIPKYKKEVDGLNINKLNSEFNKIYKKNSNKGYNILKKEYFKVRDKPKKERVSFLLELIKNRLFEHK